MKKYFLIFLLSLFLLHIAGKKAEEYTYYSQNYPTEKEYSQILKDHKEYCSTISGDIIRRDVFPPLLLLAFSHRAIRMEIFDFIKNKG